MMREMSCLERDRIILAFALAANERNIAVGDWEEAVSEPSRTQLHEVMLVAESSCLKYREMVLSHCHEHGC